MNNKIIFYLDNTSVSNLARGYARETDTDSHTCLICGQEFEQGVIYRNGERLLDAEKAAKEHVAAVHGDMFDVLIGLGKEQTGLTEVQEGLLKHIRAGLPDRDIAKQMGDKSPSTVRNQRFYLRKQKKQAKLFLALMELLEEGSSAAHFVDFHADIPTKDDRAIVTMDEAEAILSKYFVDEGRYVLKRFPLKQKEKLVILNRISEFFEDGKTYTEKEVNGILSPSFDDYVTIRRYLIEYGFLVRKPDGSEYRRA
jgi:hypothetical protein